VSEILPKYRWLLFDADDTLFDYPKAETKALQWTFEELGLVFNSEYLGIYQRYNRQVWHEFEQGQLSSLELRTKRFQLLFTETGLPVDPDAFSPKYLKNLARGSDLLEGTAEVLHKLAEQCHLCVVTNGLTDVQRPRLEKSSIAPLIEKIFISDEMGVAKPDPAFFERVFESIGQPAKKDVLIVGDSLSSDMLGGVQYGIDTCWFNPSGKTTDLPLTFEIHSLQELIPLIQANHAN
jgi:2-haloacid dehalogenase